MSGDDQGFCPPRGQPGEQRKAAAENEQLEERFTDRKLRSARKNDDGDEVESDAKNKARILEQFEKCFHPPFAMSTEISTGRALFMPNGNWTGSWTFQDKCVPKLA